MAGFDPAWMSEWKHSPWLYWSWEVSTLVKLVSLSKPLPQPTKPRGNTASEHTSKMKMKFSRHITSFVSSVWSFLHAVKITIFIEVLFKGRSFIKMKTYKIKTCQHLWSRTLLLLITVKAKHQADCSHVKAVMFSDWIVVRSVSAHVTGKSHPASSKYTFLTPKICTHTHRCNMF